jgi:hypothetical protein
VGRGRRQAEPPGDQVPDRRSQHTGEQCVELVPGLDSRDIDHIAAYCLCDRRPEDHEGYEVEESGPGDRDAG